MTHLVGEECEVSNLSLANIQLIAVDFVQFGRHGDLLKFVRNRGCGTRYRDDLPQVSR